MAGQSCEDRDIQAERCGALAGIGLALVCGFGFWRFGWWPFLPLGAVSLVGLVGGHIANTVVRHRRAHRSGNQ